MNKTRQGL